MNLEWNIRCKFTALVLKIYLSQLQWRSLGNKNGKAIRSSCLSMQGWCGKLSHERKLKLRVLSPLLTTMRTNFFPERPLTLIFTWNFTNNDEQMYRHAGALWKRVTSKIYSKSYCGFYTYFDLLKWKNLNELE